MTTVPITKLQVVRLQTLWSLLCRRTAIQNDRAARLAWVSGLVDRAVASFKELSQTEAERAMGALEAQLPTELVTHARPGRRRAHEIGTAGRRGRQSSAIALPDAKSWDRLSNAMGALGWTREKLDAFLRSPFSPTHGHAIRTLADLNRVHWALKKMLKRRAEIPSAQAHALVEAAGARDAAVAVPQQTF
ncbi:MAG: hypothetical protein WA871_13355 [Candidatus Acidiferrales bacterium]